MKTIKFDDPAVFAQLEDLIADIHTKIELLEDTTEKIVLTEFYINGKEWGEIAEIVGYGERQVHRKHGNALEHLKMSLNVTKCH